MASGIITKNNWKLKDNSTRFSSLSYNELLIQLFTESDDRTSYTFYIPKEILDSNYKVFRSGKYASSSSYGDAYFQISKTSIGSYGIRVNGQSVSTTMTVYYR